MTYRSVGFACPLGSTLLAGNPSGTAGSNDAVGTNAFFNYPSGMVMSPDRSYTLVADYINHKVRKIVVSTAVVTTVVGLGTSSNVDGGFNFATIAGPGGLVMSSNSGFALCTAFDGHTIRYLNLLTSTASTIGGWYNNAGSTDGVGTNARFYSPYGITLSNDNSFAIIADSLNNRIRKIVVTTSTVTTLAGGTGSSDGVGTLAGFATPMYVTFAADNSFVLISDAHRIRTLDLSAMAVTTVAGTGSPGAQNGVGISASFNFPMGIVLTADKSVAFVSDLSNGLVRKVVLSTRVVTTLSITSTSPIVGPEGLIWLEQDSVLLISAGSRNNIQRIYETCPSPAPTSSPVFKPTRPPTPCRHHWCPPVAPHVPRPRRLH
jgi:hypothetical protein